jgi:hypothetical protein
MRPIAVGIGIPKRRCSAAAVAKRYDGWLMTEDFCRFCKRWADNRFEEPAFFAVSQERLEKNRPLGKAKKYFPIILARPSRVA